MAEEKKKKTGVKSDGMEKKKNLTVCSHAKKCGGCQYQKMSYEEQLRKKQKAVSILLKPFGKVNPIMGMESPYYY